MPKKPSKKTKKIDQILTALQVLIKDSFKRDEKMLEFEKEIIELRMTLACLLSYYSGLKDFEEKIFTQNRKDKLSEP